MAWTPDGFWKPEDSDAAGKVASVVSAGGPLMKQAAGLGMSTANRRGLANSSMAAGMAQAETYKVAVLVIQSVHLPNRQSALGMADLWC